MSMNGVIVEILDDIESLLDRARQKLDSASKEYANSKPVRLSDAGLVQAAYKAGLDQVAEGLVAMSKLIQDQADEISQLKQEAAFLEGTVRSQAETCKKASRAYSLVVNALAVGELSYKNRILRRAAELLPYALPAHSRLPSEVAPPPHPQEEATER